MMAGRRRILGGALVLLAAPALVRQGLVMPVRPVPTQPHPALTEEALRVLWVWLEKPTGLVLDGRVRIIGTRLPFSALGALDAASAQSQVKGV